jgi:hypothetical protein
LGVIGEIVPSEAINAATRREWRELGYFYDRDDVLKEWRILGTSQGLLEFARHIREYASNPTNSQESEHIHIGPYWYLEIGTWPTPEITDHWIAGPLEALARLALQIEESIPHLRPPAIVRLRSSFAPTSPYELVLEAQSEGFDPARADPKCWANDAQPIIQRDA